MTSSDARPGAEDATPAAHRLAAQLRYARDHVPYYQALLPVGPITSGNAFAVLRVLPVLTRQDVQADRPRLWSLEGDPTGWRTARTTGVTGNPVEVAIDSAAREAERNALHRHVTELVPRLDESGYSVFHLTLHAAARSRVAGQAGNRLVKWNLSQAWPLSDEQFADRLRAVDGQVVTMMPSVAATLVDRVRSARPALIVLSGEVITESLRERVGQAFGCPVTSMYTLAEMGIAGIECGTSGGYHVSDDVVAELTGDRVTLTSLTNRAMPLLRYDTGDLGDWDEHACSCAAPKPLLRLTRARSVRVLARHGARELTSVDVAKLLAQLAVAAVEIVQEPDRVVVRYRGSPLPETTATAVAASIRGLLGPATVVDVLRAETVTEGPTAPLGGAPTVVGGEPDADAVVAWARKQFRGITGVRAAAITGSVLSPETYTRYSDIDLTIVVDENGSRWLGLATSLHRQLAGLRVNVSTLAALRDAPLVRARLLTESRLVLGELTGIRWPTADEVTAEARFWAQDATAILWTQATAVTPSADVVRTAWLTSRFSLDGLRYRYLARGARSTAAANVLALAAAENAPALEAIRFSLETATERLPPFPDEGQELLVSALSTVDWVRRGLAAGPGAADDPAQSTSA
ncbi:hypothetical protein AB0M83_15525 [Amycolatopsis sp. NPDC051106]|uniref:hypothetical protein n=1 Tax=unclassified Amycolatopsis TaxID=2618356 RepID=UPI003445B9C7